jgi:hypothetical protein
VFVRVAVLVLGAVLVLVGVTSGVFPSVGVAESATVIAPAKVRTLLTIAGRSTVTSAARLSPSETTAA